MCNCSMNAETCVKPLSNQTNVTVISSWVCQYQVFLIKKRCVAGYCHGNHSKDDDQHVFLGNLSVEPSIIGFRVTPPKLSNMTLLIVFVYSKVMFQSVLFKTFFKWTCSKTNPNAPHRHVHGSNPGMHSVLGRWIHLKTTLTQVLFSENN